MKNLLIKSQKIKRDADKILNDSALLKILKKYGAPKIVGSYDYDLMMNGDIDIHLFVKKLDKEKAVELLNELIEQNYFDKYALDDWVKINDPRLPEGYYIGLKKRISDYKKRWKIDIWQLTKDTPGSLKYQKLIKDRLNNDLRKLILELKDLRNSKYPDLPSTTIYSLIFNGKVRSKEDFKNYFKDKDTSSNY
ncbi:hypothetical protein KJ713_00430 [Patescibacteria group bacterium]|nr:hypothetical protein [Patescibacteria group bacterium]